VGNGTIQGFNYSSFGTATSCTSATVSVTRSTRETG